MKYLAFITAIMLAGCAGCSGDKLPEPTVVEKRAAAGTKYGAELLDCVNQNDSGAAADKCAEGVRARWDAGGAK